MTKHSTLQNQLKEQRRLDRHREQEASKELGDYQSLVLAAVLYASNSATVDEVLGWMSDRFGTPDVAQTYVTITTLLKRGHLDRAGQRVNEETGRPSWQYRMTRQGYAALTHSTEVKAKRAQILEQALKPSDA